VRTLQDLRVTEFAGYEDYVWAAGRISCDLALLRALAIKEWGRQILSPRMTHGPGIDSPSLILYEPHKFSEKTNHEFDATHPYVSQRTALGSGYGTHSAQYDKLAQAADLNEWAALQSASFGQFQIMGENFAMMDCDSPRTFVEALTTSTKAQLSALAIFVCHRKDLRQAMISLDWKVIARRYNGSSGSAGERYAEDLKENYRALKHCPA
jgi:hypothetical protein